MVKPKTASPRTKDLLIFWSSDLLIFWSSDLLIFWSYDLMILWSIFHFPIMAMAAMAILIPMIEFSRKKDFIYPCPWGVRVKWGTFNPPKNLKITYKISTVWHRMNANSEVWFRRRKNSVSNNRVVQKKCDIYPCCPGGERVKWGTFNPQKNLASTYEISTVWHKIKKLY